MTVLSTEMKHSGKVLAVWEKKLDKQNQTYKQFISLKMFANALIL